MNAKAYNSAINEYIEKGFAEKVPDQNVEDKIVRYLPHHAVFRDDKKTTRSRIVFDASAREGDSVSINDCVLLGPVLHPNLASVLIRFRTNRIGLITDTEKMFLQVKLALEDHRYLWRDLQPNEAPNFYRMQKSDIWGELESIPWYFHSLCSCEKIRRTVPECSSGNSTERVCG